MPRGAATDQRPARAAPAPTLRAEDGARACPSAAGTRSRCVQTSLFGVRAFIDRHYARPLRVDPLAARAGLSTFHFIRRFRAAFGSTPHQYLRARRLERARELLETTPWPVTEICDAVGFSSLGSFSSLFRRATGETPGEYRARRRCHARIPVCFLRMYRAE